MMTKEEEEEAWVRRDLQLEQQSYARVRVRVRVRVREMEEEEPRIVYVCGCSVVGVGDCTRRHFRNPFPLEPSRQEELTERA